jgi:hypothetical protein
MNGPKIINGQDAVAKYSLSSSIRVIGQKFTANPLIGRGRLPVFTTDSLRTFPVLQRFMFACAIPAAAVCGAVVATNSLGSTIRYTPNLFLCAVVLSSWLGGVGAGIFSIFLSVIALDYFFLPPIYALGLTLEETPDIVLFVTAGLFVNWLSRDGREAKNALREGRDERKSVSSEEDREGGKTDDSLRAGISSGVLANGKLAHEASGAKGIKKFRKLPNLIANNVQGDEELRRELCSRESGSDKAQLLPLNGSRKAIRNRLTRRSAREALFCKRGDYWIIEYKGKTTWLKGTRGLECLACLLGNPGREFHVRELIGLGQPVSGLAEQSVQQDGYHMRTMWLETGVVILDSHAKTEYKQRLAELREELHDAEFCNDPGRVEKIQEESDAIAKQLAAAIGLDGRDRNAASQAERARTAVAKRIRGSIKRISKATPALGCHLAVCIKTGYFCSYRPDPGVYVSWKLRP